MNAKPLTSETARAAANSGRQNLSREFHDLVADIEDLVKQTASLSGEELNLARARLAELIASAKTSAEDMGSAVAQRARREQSPVPAPSAHSGARQKAGGPVQTNRGAIYPPRYPVGPGWKLPDRPDRPSDQPHPVPR